VTPSAADQRTIDSLDDATRALVRLSAAVTAGTESQRHQAITQASLVTPALWVEELLLQSYLFAGFPRTLNAMRDWRATHPEVVSADSVPSADSMRHGERTCATVYGAAYDRLRVNIRHLHPLLDEWMISEGYGKVLSRPGLDLGRRELCIVAACAAARQDRQLHSHLHGARNAGVPDHVVAAAIDVLEGLVAADGMTTARLLWSRVRGK
jgi:4-carboxymuconolactone decarboxylase